MLDLRPVLVVQPGDESQKLGARQLFVDERAIGDEPELGSSRRSDSSINIDPADVDRAARRAEDAGDHPQRRRLPGAVGAEKSEQLAFRHFEVDAVDGGEAAVPLGDVRELDHLAATRAAGGMAPVHADDVDLQVAHESKQFRLTRYPPYDEPEVRRVSRELTECWIDRTQSLSKISGHAW